jgi:hypothetical protein
MLVDAIQCTFQVIFVEKGYKMKTRAFRNRTLRYNVKVGLT